MKRIVCLVMLLSVSVLIFSQHSESAEKKRNFSAGIGYGIPYGVIGGIIEYKPVKYFGLCFGFGYALEGAGYSVGIRAFPMGDDKRFNPFASAYAGVVGVVLDEETFTGFAFGGGVRWISSSRKLSLTSEILFLSYKKKSWIDYGGNIKFAEGIQWHF